MKFKELTLKYLLNKVLLILVASCSALSATAQTIAVVDMMRISKELQLEQKVQQRVNKIYAEDIAQFQKLRSDYEAAVKKLEKDKGLMAQKEVRDSMRDLESKKMKIQLDGKALDQDIKVSLMQHRDIVLDHIKVSIDKVSKKKKYDLVLQKGAVITYSKKTDISDLVIKDLNQHPLNISSLKPTKKTHATSINK